MAKKAKKKAEKGGNAGIVLSEKDAAIVVREPKGDSNPDVDVYVPDETTAPAYMVTFLAWCLDQQDVAKKFEDYIENMVEGDKKQ